MEKKKYEQPIPERTPDNLYLLYQELAKEEMEMANHDDSLGRPNASLVHRAKYEAYTKAATLAKFDNPYSEEFSRMSSKH